MHKLLAFLVLLLRTFTLNSSAQTVTRDITYTTDSTGTYRADFYQPSSSGLHPAIVLIHGGSWRTGNKQEMRKLAADLAGHGYVGFSISYNLHSHSFPISWEESRAAIRFLRDNASKYHIDSHHIAVLGTSAGAQLAALVATAPQGPAISRSETDHARVDVQAAVVLNGIYDLHVEHFLLRRYLGGKCVEITATCDDASPSKHLQSSIPPFFVGHGNHDRLIPYKQAIDFIEELRAANDDVTPFVADHGPHSYWKKDRYYDENLTAVEDFLDRVMKVR